MLNKLLKKMGYLPHAEGTSMLPIIYPNDGIYFKSVSFSQLKINDLIVFKENNSLIVHRTIYKRPTCLISKGDNSPIADKKIKPSQILGRVYQIKRNGKIINPENIYLIQSTLYFQELVKIIRTFEKENINYVFLKGLPLHLYYDGSLPGRLYADCDILIDVSQYWTVNKFLKKLGFIAEKKIKSSLLFIYIGSEDKEINYYKKINGIRVILEIHNQITFSTHKVPNPFVDFENNIKLYSRNLLKQKRIVKVNGVEMPFIDSNNLVLYLFLHFYTHLYNGPFRLSLISQIIKKDKINWFKILQEADKLKVINFIIPSLFLLKKYFQIGSPYYLSRSLYKKNFNYSIGFYKFLRLENNFFSYNYSFSKTRLMRALLILLFIDEGVFKKILVIFKPNLILHSIYFVFSVFRAKLSSFFSNRKVGS